MKLYFSPLSCSLATRIALYASSQAAELVEVDPTTKRTPDGTDYRSIHPLGLVPALRLDDGRLLTENAAVLQYVADRNPDANLAPRESWARTQLHQWLCFIGTELHKGVFNPVFDRTAPDAVKAYALARAEPRLTYVATHLEGRDYLLDHFTVADGYLFTVLTWTIATPIQLSRWPVLAAYRKRIEQHPAVARAFAEERTLYTREQAARAAAT